MVVDEEEAAPATQDAYVQASEPTMPAQGLHVFRGLDVFYLFV